MCFRFIFQTSKLCVSSTTEWHLPTVLQISTISSLHKNPSKQPCKKRKRTQPLGFYFQRVFYHLTVSSFRLRTELKFTTLSYYHDLKPTSISHKTYISQNVYSKTYKGSLTNLKAYLNFLSFFMKIDSSDKNPVYSIIFHLEVCTQVKQ